MRKQIVVYQFAAALACGLLSAPLAAQPEQKQMSPAEMREQLNKEAQDTTARYRKVDPAIERFFKESAGYVVFPRVGKVGFIIGGGHGAGEVFERGRMIGTVIRMMLTGGRKNPSTMTKNKTIASSTHLDRCSATIHSAADWLMRR